MIEVEKARGAVITDVEQDILLVDLSRDSIRCHGLARLVSCCLNTRYVSRESPVKGRAPKHRVIIIVSEIGGDSKSFAFHILYRRERDRSELT